MIVFGPIPSRRLGRSLGINNIPPKHCSYACIYCQVGSTNRLQIRREHFFQPARIRGEVEEKLERVYAGGNRVDYLTFVPDGEPTLDAALGKSIDLLRTLGIKIAVITNGSLLTNPAVVEDLLKADYVSIKLDASNERTWQAVNRPQGSLNFNALLDAIQSFSGLFKGTLVTETMLVRDVNDRNPNVTELRSFLGDLKPSIAYLSVPTRPPAEKWVEPPLRQDLAKAYRSWRKALPFAELLTEYEGTNIGVAGTIDDEILSVASVHPIREDALRAMLKKAQAGWSVVERLVGRKELIQKKYGNRLFYVRNLKQ